MRQQRLGYPSMDDDQKPSVLVQYIGVLAFIAMSLGALVIFGFFAIDTAEQLIATPPSIAYNKGIFYMLGGGIGLGALVIGMIVEIWNKKPRSDRNAQRVARTAISGVVIMFVLPQVAHYAVANYLEPRGYEVCGEASYQWLHYQDIIYTNNPEVCLQLAREKNNKVQRSDKVRSTANELY